MPNPRCIPTDATSIRIPIWALTILVTNIAMITTPKPVNEVTMPTSSFDVLFLDMSHARPVGKRSVTAVLEAP